MIVDTLIFHCCFTGPAELPPYKGSTLRGAFGHALRQVCCALRRRTCRDCILAATCCYSIVFESERLDKHSGGYRQRLAARPHPYVLEPPLDERRQYQAGDHLVFSMHLFGPARRFRPQIVYAVTRMGENGLGKNDGGRFILDRVTAGDTIVYDADSGRLSMEEIGRPLTCAVAADPCDALAISLVTPFRVKRDNVFVRRFDFGTLARAALRRVSSLENAYGDGEPDVDYPALARLADTVAVAADHTGWLDISRYSNRQKRPMQMGGIVGRVEVTGELGPLLPFLRYCETVHLGKQTAFGHGWIRLESEPREAAA